MARHKTGILLLPYLQKRTPLFQLLCEAAKHVQKTLYVNLLPENSLLREECIDLATAGLESRFVNEIYSHCAPACPGIDIRVLLGPSNLQHSQRLSRPLDVCLINQGAAFDDDKIQKFLQKRFSLVDAPPIVYVQAPDESSDALMGEANSSDTYERVDGVVIGGTFDRLHDGHKLLIATALWIARDKFTCGVSDGPLLERKTLRELIEPLQTRLQSVKDFVEDCKPGLHHKIVPISDACGPAGTDSDLHVLLVSKETEKSSAVVNLRRKENGLPELDVRTIDLVASESFDLPADLRKEGKFSSSAARVRSLGSLMKSPNTLEASRPYLIGLTGGSATGKSAVAKRLEGLGAYAINCDKLGHDAYSPGTRAYNLIVQNFGDAIVSDDKTIDRKRLGPMVFSDKSKLQLLNSIVWPEIAIMISKIVEQIRKDDGHHVVVLDAAVLLEAGWDKLVHEVWVSIVPPAEALRRMLERDSVSEAQAMARISSQMTNQERVDRAHVVLSTLWEPEFTQRQVEKAWTSLRERVLWSPNCS